MVLQVMQKKNFDNPDESKSLHNSKVDTVNIGDMTLVRYTYFPGWCWSKDMKPTAGTSSCQVHHVGIRASGRLHVRSNNGQEIEFGLGHVVDIPPGHDGWIVGNELGIFYSFTGKSTAK